MVNRFFAQVIEHHKTHRTRFSLHTHRDTTVSVRRYNDDDTYIFFEGFYTSTYAAGYTFVI